MSLLDFIDTSKLTEVSKNQYASKAVKLMDLFKKPLSGVISDAESSLEKLKSLYTNQKTLKGYVGFIMTVFKYNPEFKSKHKEAYGVWESAFKNVAETVMDGLKENKPTEKQRAGFVEFADIKAKRTTLPKASDDRLIVSLYSLMPPLRADFNSVVVFTTKPKGKVEDKNYIVLNKTKKQGKLYLNEYKTSKTYGTIERDFGSDLYQEIIDSMTAHPRTYLFEKHGEPYDPNTFQKYVNRRLKVIFGKPLTISLIRHSYINSLDMNRLSVKEKEELATEMGHSVNTQALYRLIF